MEESGDLEAAVQAYEDMLERWDALDVHAWALNNMSTLLDVLGRKEDALEAAERCFAAAWSLRDDEEFDGIAAGARAFQASLLGDLGRFQQALAVSREVSGLYFGRNVPTVRRAVAVALLNESDVLRQLDRRHDEIEVCDRTIEWLESDLLTDELMPFHVGALAAKCAALTASGRPAEACAAVERIESFREPQPPAVFRELSFLMMYGGIALEAVGEPERAADVYRGLLARVEAGEEGADARALTYVEPRLRRLSGRWN